MTPLTVSELADRVDTTADTVRYYERIGVMPEADRSDAGYRLYGDEDVSRLRFIKRAQRFGLRLDDIRDLVHIRDDGLCPCGHAEELLRDRLAEVEEQIASLERLGADIRGLLEGGDEGGATWPCGDGSADADGEPAACTCGACTDSELPTDHRSKEAP